MYKKWMYFNAASFELKLSWEWGREGGREKGKSEESKAECEQTEDTTKPTEVHRYVKKVTPSTTADRLLGFSFFKKKCTKGQWHPSSIGVLVSGK